MPGYSLAAVDQSRIDERSLCPNCKGLLKEAVQTVECGHRYCKTCVDALLDHEDGKCVIDGSDIKREQVFLDRFIEREIQSMLVHCVHHDQGCDWKDELKKRQDHEAVCAYVQVPCVHSGCGELVTRANLVEHLEHSCKFRMEKCEYCLAFVEFAFMEGHQESECSSVPTDCLYCGRKDIPRAQLLEHQDPVIGDCDGVEGPCPFEQIGCSKTEVYRSEEKKNHLKKAKSFHAVLLLHFALLLAEQMEALVTKQQRIMSIPHILINNEGTVSDLLSQIQTISAQNRGLAEIIREHNERINSLERTMALRNFSAVAPSSQVSGHSASSGRNNEITRKLANIENKTADHEVLLVEANRLIREVNRDVDNIRRLVETVQETVRKVERRIEAIEHRMTLRNFAEDMSQRLPPSYDGHLLWKINEFSRRRNRAVNGQQKAFTSPCFFTGPYGYKMRARIYLNGNGMGRGTHISVFFVVMRGQYDEILRWPFRQKVTFMLVDQDNVEHVIDAFRPDPNSSSFQRPRREENIASGCPLFCSLNQLNRHAYVREDTLFLRITVDDVEDFVVQQL